MDVGYIRFEQTPFRLVVQPTREVIPQRPRQSTDPPAVFIFSPACVCADLHIDRISIESGQNCGSLGHTRTSVSLVLFVPDTNASTGGIRVRYALHN